MTVVSTNSVRVEPQGSLDLDGYHLPHEVLRGTLSNEMAKLKELRKAHQMKQRSRRKSVMMTKVLKESASERQLVDDLSSKMADNIIHRYGKGFRRVQGRKYSIKVRPSIFSADFGTRYRVPTVPGATDRSRASPEQNTESSGRAKPHIDKTKVHAPLPSILKSDLKEESRDSLDELLELNELNLK